MSELLQRIRRASAAAVAVRGAQAVAATALEIAPSAGRSLSRALEKGGPRPVFPAPLAGERPRWRALLDDADIARIGAAADEARRGAFSLLHTPFAHAPTRPSWYVDPVTGHAWSRGFFTRVDYLSIPGGTDVKRVWELSRLQWLVPVALRAALSGDLADARFVVDVVRSFDQECPFTRGVHWSVTLEPAVRILTLVHLRDLLGDLVGPEDRAFLNARIAEHLAFVATFVEYGSVRGNHYVGDLAAVVVGGAALRGTAAARRLATTAMTLLDRELPIEIAGDGVQYEASTSYHRFVAELAILARRAADLIGVERTERTISLLAAAGRYTVATTRDDGSAPLHGDSDDACALGVPRVDPRALANLADTLSGDVAHGAYPGGVAAVLACFGAPAAERLRARAPARDRSAAFPSSGYFVLRNEGGDHVFVDAARVGLAGRGGHGHNDCLSFELALRGTWLFAEGGCSTYTGDRARRAWERSTAAHNTPIVAGLEQNDPEGLWFMRERTRPKVVSWSDGGDLTELVAEHDGFVERAGILVRRRVALEHARHRLSVTDTFTGARPSEIVEPFILAPGVSIDRKGDRAFELTRGGARFVLRAESAREVRVEGVEVGVAYGARLSSHRIVFVDVHHTPTSEFRLTVESRVE